MGANFKIEHIDEKENPYSSTGYVRLPDSREVMTRIKNNMRAPEPSPLIKEICKERNLDWKTQTTLEEIMMKVRKYAK
jgi:hypothetical protein